MTNPTPATGGSYTRDPVTGALTRNPPEAPPASEAAPVTPPAAVPLADLPTEADITDAGAADVAARRKKG